MIYLAYRMIDNADGSLYGLAIEDEVIDGVLLAEVIGGFLQAGQDEDIEIGDIFVCDVAFGVYIFDPFAAGVGAEQDYHMCGWELLADYPRNQL